MNLIDYLFKMDINEVKIIAIHLQTLPDDKITSRNWIITKITEIILNIEKLHSRVIPKMNNTTVAELVKYVFTNEPLSPSSIKELTYYGLAYNGEIPLDIKDLLRTNSRSIAVKEFDNQKFDTNHSTFLRFIQLLNYFRSKNAVTYNFKKFQKQLQKIMQELAIKELESTNIRKMIDYLIITEFIKREKNKLYFNHKKFNQWVLQDSIISIREFYQQLRKSSYLFQYLEQISGIQEKEEEWINTSYLSKVPFGLETARGNGLVRETQNNDKNFVQLTPEGWFLMKGFSPKSWIEKSLLVSADFELFVPHTYDPFFMIDIDSFCLLRQNDYFLVYDMYPLFDDNSYENNKLVEGFINLIRRKSRNIPNVVEYEFQNHIKNRILN